MRTTPTIRIIDITMSKRARQALALLKVTTLDELYQLTIGQPFSMKHVGPTTRSEIFELLNRRR